MQERNHKNVRVCNSRLIAPAIERHTSAFHTTEPDGQLRKFLIVRRKPNTLRDAIAVPVKQQSVNRSVTAYKNVMYTVRLLPTK